MIACWEVTFAVLWPVVPLPIAFWSTSTTVLSRLGEAKRSRQAGDAAADDGDVGACLVLEPGPARAPLLGLEPGREVDAEIGCIGAHAATSAAGKGRAIGSPAATASRSRPVDVAARVRRPRPYWTPRPLMPRQNAIQTQTARSATQNGASSDPEIGK